MTARFAVDGTLHLTSRGLFVVYGRPIDGSARAGQLVWSPEVIASPVRALEWLLRSATERTESLALCFAYRDEAELAGWQRAAADWDVLELRDPDEPVPYPRGVGDVFWSDGKKHGPAPRPGQYPRGIE